MHAGRKVKEEWGQRKVTAQGDSGIVREAKRKGEVIMEDLREKDGRSTAKKMLALAALLLLIVATLGGTLAYFTATTNEVRNTFTIGKVAITLDEAKVDAMGVPVEGQARVESNEYKLVPGHTYTKGPTVKVGDESEDCWVFVKVVNGLETFEKSGSTTIASQMANKGWTAVSGSEGVYGRSAKSAAGESLAVFENFTIDDEAGLSEVVDTSSLNVTVQAAAVQADGFATSDAAWTAAGSGLFA